MRPRLLLALLTAALAASAIHAQDGGPSLTLGDAIRLALANNRNLKVVSYSRRIARANWLAEVGAFDPSLNFGRSYSDSREPSSLGSAQLDEIRTNSYSLGLQGRTPWGLSYNIGGTAQNQGDLYGGFAPDFLTFGGFQVTQPLLKGFGFGANLQGCSHRQGEPRHLGLAIPPVCHEHRDQRGHRLQRPPAGP